jgi:hypothetical protein
VVGKIVGQEVFCAMQQRINQELHTILFPELPRMTCQRFPAKRNCIRDEPFHKIAIEKNGHVSPECADFVLEV